MKRCVSILLSVILLVMILTGCQLTSTAKSTAATTQPSVGQTTAVTTAEDLPKLNFLAPYANVDMNKYPVHDVVEKLTGYKVNYNVLPAEDAMTKINLVMATGGGYDIVSIPNPLTNFYQFATQGAVHDLTSLLDKQGKNVLLAMDGYTYIDPLRIDGKVMCIPQPNPGAYVGDGNFIRQDWLDAVGLKIPKTTDDMLTVLRAFKEKNPGKSEAVIPYVQGTSVFPSIFAGAFGLASEYVEENGKLISRIKSAKMSAYLHYMNTLYREKLLDNEFVVNTNAIIDEKIFSGKAGVFNYGVFGMPAFIDSFTKNQPNGKYTLLNLLKGPSGDLGVAVSRGYFNYNVVPVSSQNAEHVIKFLNKFYQEDNFRIIYDGEEGVHWKYNDKKEMVPIQPAFGEQRGIGSYIYGIGAEWQLKYWTIRLQKDQRLYDWFNTMQKAMPVAVRVYNPLDLAPPIASLTNSKAALTELVNEYIVKFITGALPISQYDAFIAKYNAAGGSQVETDLNAWYAKK